MKSSLSSFCLIHPRTTLNDPKFSFDNSVVKIEVPTSDSSGDPYLDDTGDGGSAEEDVIKFDHVFPPNTSQERVFQEVARPHILAALTSFRNAIFIASGATGSGKTFAVTGGAQRFTDRGLIPRSVSALFEALSQRPEKDDVEVSVSFYELYKDSVIDLLSERRRKVPVKPGDNGPMLVGLLRQVVATESDAYHLLFQGDSNRHFERFPHNSETSRGHVFYLLHVNHVPSGSRATVAFVDLAAPIAVRNSANTAIAESVDALKATMLALRDGREPYWQSSILPQLLEPWLRPGIGHPQAHVCLLNPVRYEPDTRQEAHEWLSFIRLMQEAYSGQPLESSPVWKNRSSSWEKERKEPLLGSGQQALAEKLPLWRSGPDVVADVSAELAAAASAMAAAAYQPEDAGPTPDGLTSCVKDMQEPRMPVVPPVPWMLPSLSDVKGERPQPDAIASDNGQASELAHWPGESVAGGTITPQARSYPWEQTPDLALVTPEQPTSSSSPEAEDNETAAKSAVPAVVEEKPKPSGQATPPPGPSLPCMVSAVQASTGPSLRAVTPPRAGQLVEVSRTAVATIATGPSWRAGSTAPVEAQDVTRCAVPVSVATMSNAATSACAASPSRVLAPEGARSISPPRTLAAAPAMTIAPPVVRSVSPGVGRSVSPQPQRPSMLAVQQQRDELQHLQYTLHSQTLHQLTAQAPTSVALGMVTQQIPAARAPSPLPQVQGAPSPVVPRAFSPMRQSVGQLPIARSPSPQGRWPQVLQAQQRPVSPLPAQMVHAAQPRQAPLYGALAPPAALPMPQSASSSALGYFSPGIASPLGAVTPSVTPPVSAGMFSVGSSSGSHYAPAAQRSSTPTRTGMPQQLVAAPPAFALGTCQLGGWQGCQTPPMMSPLAIPRAAVERGKPSVAPAAAEPAASSVSAAAQSPNPPAAAMERVVVRGGGNRRES
mmetsp:Transcript_10789/g.19171  ORF Transcript_10789/g.19171 Transcript_10789/m.19171 type:complete len:943 (+) Transcript_10789:47-2875(+)